MWFWGPITFCGYLLYLPPASQVRSATAIHKATSCPAPCQSCVRSRSAVVRGRSDAPGKQLNQPISCSFSAAAAAVLSLLLLPTANTPECSHLHLPFKCSGFTHAAPAHWHTGTLPGTQVHRLLSCHFHHIPITFPSPPSPACQYQNNNKQRDPCRPIRAGPIRAGPVAGPVKVRAHRNFSLLAVAQRRGRTRARVPAQGRTQPECRVPGAGGLGLVAAQGIFCSVSSAS